MRIIFGEAFISLNYGDDIYKVLSYYEGRKLKKGYAYIKGDYVYPYMGKYKKDEDNLPGIYKKDGEYIFIETDDMEEYSVDNIIELDSGTIIEQIKSNKDNFIQAEDIEFINNNAEVYQPTIKETDDFLKYLVKRIILDKKINLRNYKHKFPNEYSLNNMKSGLNKGTKMTVPNFNLWCEILGVKFEIRVYDAGTDKNSPLPEDIIISSDDF